MRARIKRIKENILDLELEEIKRLATNRRKIQNACEILGIKEVNERIERIVSTRNRFDVAHAMRARMHGVSKELIVNYMKTLNRKP